MHRFLLHNDQIRETSEALLSPGQVGYLNGWGVFSTLRVSKGVLFAFERHYERMKHDAVRMRVPFALSPSELEVQLHRLIAANGAYEATLRVAIVRNGGGMWEAPGISRAADLIAFTAPLRDWGNSVRLAYVPQARHAASRFAGAKVTSWAQNLTWYEEAHERGFDEMILLNEHGAVSECTSANIFVIQKNEVWTPPLTSSGCLPGITRAILLEEIEIAGLKIAERDITPSELESGDQVFITSSTRDLLPVGEIEGEALAQTPELLHLLSRAFANYRERYIVSPKTTAVQQKR